MPFSSFWLLCKRRPTPRHILSADDDYSLTALALEHHPSEMPPASSVGQGRVLPNDTGQRCKSNNHKNCGIGARSSDLTWSTPVPVDTVTQRFDRAKFHSTQALAVEEQRQLANTIQDLSTIKR